MLRLPDTVSVPHHTDNELEYAREKSVTLQFGWWDHFEQRSDMPLWQQYDERIETMSASS
jgi:hypothetical protein